MHHVHCTCCLHLNCLNVPCRYAWQCAYAYQQQIHPAHAQDHVATRLITTDTHTCKVHTLPPQPPLTHHSWHAKLRHHHSASGRAHNSHDVPAHVCSKNRTARCWQTYPSFYTTGHVESTKVHRAKTTKREDDMIQAWPATSALSSP